MGSMNSENPAQTSTTIRAPQGCDMAVVVGDADRHLKMLQQAFRARITVRGDEAILEGDPIEVQALVVLIGDLMKAAASEGEISPEYVSRAISLAKTAEFAPSRLRDDVLLTYRGKAIRPKTAGQKVYADAIRSHTITFGIGPAGTGKTYLAMALAIAALKAKQVGKIVLTRPIVEAGENLGFLPGTLEEKVDPYIRPLYDALFDMVDRPKALQLIEDGTVEIVPLAFMRGRTLNDSFIVLDEAQNATAEQMKMFLTRLGFGSKMVVTGDITQTDLAPGASGLAGVRGILEGIEGIAFCDLTSVDVVRHSLVAAIVAAYERAAGGRSAGGKG